MPDRYGNYTQDEIDAVKQANDLVAVYQREWPHFKSWKSGQDWIGPCPVHGGSDPLHINITKRLWKCWVCNEGGDLIKLITWGLHKDFKEAMRYLGAGGAIDTEEIRRRREEYEKQQAAEAEHQATEMATIRNKIAQARLWESLHNSMTEEQIEWWRTQTSLDPEWFGYWELGWIKDLNQQFYRPYYGWQHFKPYDPVHAEAFSIPYFTMDGAFQTIQWRYKVPNGNGKYKFSFELGTWPFITRRDLPFANAWVLVVEGAKKAMVTHVLGTDCNMQVVGLPSQGDMPPYIIDLLKSTKVSVFILDPDSWVKPDNWPHNKPFTPWPIKHARAIGRNACVAELPGKIDDHLIKGNITIADLRDIIMRACKTGQHG